MTVISKRFFRQLSNDLTTVKLALSCNLGTSLYIKKMVFRYEQKINNNGIGCWDSDSYLYRDCIA
jgi:hypothetical protein